MKANVFNVLLMPYISQEEILIIFPPIIGRMITERVSGLTKGWFLKRDMRNVFPVKDTKN